MYVEYKGQATRFGSESRSYECTERRLRMLSVVCGNTRLYQVKVATQERMEGHRPS